MSKQTRKLQTYDRGDLVSRSESRAVGCPFCGASPGVRCRSPQGQHREASHMERVDAARLLRARPSLTIEQRETIAYLAGRLGMEIPRPASESEARFVIDDLRDRERRMKRRGTLVS